MPIKWSTLKVSEAADKIEEQIKLATEPLEQARELAKEALTIPYLPQYVDQYFRRLCGEIDRAIGGGHIDPVGRFNAQLQSIRDAIPEDRVQAEQKAKEVGDQQSLL